MRFGIEVTAPLKLAVAWVFLLDTDKRIRAQSSCDAFLQPAAEGGGGGAPTLGVWCPLTSTRPGITYVLEVGVERGEDKKRESVFLCLFCLNLGPFGPFGPFQDRDG